MYIPRGKNVTSASLQADTFFEEGQQSGGNAGGGASGLVGNVPIGKERSSLAVIEAVVSTLTLNIGEYSPSQAEKTKMENMKASLGGTDVSSGKGIPVATSSRLFVTSMGTNIFCRSHALNVEDFKKYISIWSTVEEPPMSRGAQPDPVIAAPALDIVVSLSNLSSVVELLPTLTMKLLLPTLTWTRRAIAEGALWYEVSHYVHLAGSTLEMISTRGKDIAPAGKMQRKSAGASWAAAAHAVHSSSSSSRTPGGKSGTHYGVGRSEEGTAAALEGSLVILPRIHCMAVVKTSLETHATSPDERDPSAAADVMAASPLVLGAAATAAAAAAAAGTSIGAGMAGAGIPNLSSPYPYEEVPLFPDEHRSVILTDVRAHVAIDSLENEITSAVLESYLSLNDALNRNTDELLDRYGADSGKPVEVSRLTTRLTYSVNLLLQGISLRVLSPLTAIILRTGPSKMVVRDTGLEDGQVSWSIALKNLTVALCRTRDATSVLQVDKMTSDLELFRLDTSAVVQNFPPGSGSSHAGASANAAASSSAAAGGAGTSAAMGARPSRASKVHQQGRGGGATDNKYTPANQGARWPNSTHPQEDGGRRGSGGADGTAGGTMDMMHILVTHTRAIVNPGSVLAASAFFKHYSSAHAAFEVRRKEDALRRSTEEVLAERRRKERLQKLLDRVEITQAERHKYKAAIANTTYFLSLTDVLVLLPLDPAQSPGAHMRYSSGAENLEPGSALCVSVEGLSVLAKIDRAGAGAVVAKRNSRKSRKGGPKAAPPLDLLVKARMNGASFAFAPYWARGGSARELAFILPTQNPGNRVWIANVVVDAKVKRVGPKAEAWVTCTVGGAKIFADSDLREYLLAYNLAFSQKTEVDRELARGMDAIAAKVVPVVSAEVSEAAEEVKAWEVNASVSLEEATALAKAGPVKLASKVSLALGHSRIWSVTTLDPDHILIPLPTLLVQTVTTQQSEGTGGETGDYQGTCVVTMGPMVATLPPALVPFLGAILAEPRRARASPSPFFQGGEGGEGGGGGRGGRGGRGGGGGASAGAGRETVIGRRSIAQLIPNTEGVAIGSRGSRRSGRGEEGEEGDIDDMPSGKKKPPSVEKVRQRGGTMSLLLRLEGLDLTLSCEPVSAVEVLVSVGPLNAATTLHTGTDFDYKGLTLSLERAALIIDHPHTSEESHCLHLEAKQVQMQVDDGFAVRPDGVLSRFALIEVQGLEVRGMLLQADEVFIAQALWIDPFSSNSEAETERKGSGGLGTGYGNGSGTNGSGGWQRGSRPARGGDDGGESYEEVNEDHSTLPSSALVAVTSTFYVHMHVLETRIGADMGYELGKATGILSRLHVHCGDAGRVEGQDKTLPMSLYAKAEKVFLTSEGKLTGKVSSPNGLFLEVVRDYSTPAVELMGSPLNRWKVIVPSLTAFLEYKADLILRVKTDEIVARFRDRVVEPGFSSTQGLVTIETLALEICAETVPAMSKITDILASSLAERRERAADVMEPLYKTKNIGGIRGHGHHRRGGGGRASGGGGRASGGGGGMSGSGMSGSGMGGGGMGGSVSGEDSALVPTGEVSVSVFNMSVGLFGNSIVESHWLNIYAQSLLLALGVMYTDSMEVQRIQQVRLADGRIGKMADTGKGTSDRLIYLDQRLSKATFTPIFVIPDTVLNMISLQEQYSNTLTYRFSSKFDRPIEVGLRGDMYGYIRGIARQYSGSGSSSSSSTSAGAGSSAAAKAMMDGADGSSPGGGSGGNSNGETGALVFVKEAPIVLAPRMQVGNLNVAIAEVLRNLDVSVDSIPESLYNSVTVPLSAILSLAQSVSQTISTSAQE